MFLFFVSWVCAELLFAVAGEFCFVEEFECFVGVTQFTWGCPDSGFFMEGGAYVFPGVFECDFDAFHGDDGSELVCYQGEMGCLNLVFGLVGNFLFQPVSDVFWDWLSGFGFAQGCICCGGEEFTSGCVAEAFYSAVEFLCECVADSDVGYGFVCFFSMVCPPFFCAGNG